MESNAQLPVLLNKVSNKNIKKTDGTTNIPIKTLQIDFFMRT
jgi:hypothetical protein